MDGFIDYLTIDINAPPVNVITDMNSPLPDTSRKIPFFLKFRLFNWQLQLKAIYSHFATNRLLMNSYPNDSVPQDALF